MSKKNLITIILVIIASTAIFVFLTRQKNQEPPKDGGGDGAEIILFYGQGCPHCAKVEEFINQNKVNEKISFAMKEIYYNSQNNKELREKAASCGLPQVGIGVPLLWYDSNKCLVGDVDIINFFNQKINAGSNN